MKIPRIVQARIDRNKIEEYLLSESHPDGWGKARFFMSFGFTPRQWRVFAEALRRHGEMCPVAAWGESEYGKRYVVDGPLKTPDGRSPNIRTVWIIETGETIPRLVTAHPLPR